MAGENNKSIQKNPLNELLTFIDNKTGDEVVMFYGAWMYIISGVLIKYAHKSEKEVCEILKMPYYQKPKSFFEALCLSHELEYHWAMLGAYGEQYWLKGISSQPPADYYEWYESYLRHNHLNNPFEWK